jgi:hypothetical protein
MKSKLCLLTTCFLIALTLMQASCGKSKTTSTKSSNLSTSSPFKSSTTSSSSGVVVKSSDGSLSLVAPTLWDSDNSLWPGAVIGLSGMGYYVVVLKKPKSSYAAGLTANDFLIGEHSVFEGLLYNIIWKPSSNITIGGLSGVTVNLTGKNNGNRDFMVYLISVVADNNNFYEIIGWADADMNGTDLQDLQNVTNSIKVY